MKITGLECLHANAGFRNFDFLKISTDEGLVGWSEYNESFGGMGVTEVINNLAGVLVGEDPRPIESHVRPVAESPSRPSGPSRMRCWT